MIHEPILSVDAVSPPAAFSPASDVAALGAFLEIGDRLGVLPYLQRGDTVTAEQLAADVDLPVKAVADLLEAYQAAAIVERDHGTEGGFRAVPELEWLCYQAGYVSWALNANRPFVENPREFLKDAPAARRIHHRDMREVAVSSQWMGSKAFYPALLATIFDARPSRIVDLGAGTGRLVIEVLQAFPEATGVALDMAHDACAAAVEAAKFAGVEDRMTVVEAPIQSLADDPSVLQGAQAITAGFVFHDMMPEEEEIADRILRNSRAALGADGFLAVTEAVPYAAMGWERRFSALVTYMHQQFMGRGLLTESQWRDKFQAAGFSDVVCIRQPFPTGRLFVARA
ncbi:methyltransferase [Streptomyces albipurpureus]|uniref:Methyltransferase n=1 Tax=Streptomyces albipurpureus TaxID=2897419 RepID=A0ABT0UHR5_9ACTN|nr:methyltransferase [Streptomyces sp. CWNU-1]MCM2387974.1 methyltransferase [Streptomyces sp. CWNU-1]